MAALPTVRVEVESDWLTLLVGDVIHCIVDLFGVPKIAGAAVIGPTAF